MARTFADALADAVRSIDGAGFRYAVSGGVAKALYGAPSFTKDLDLLVLADAKTVEAALRPTFTPVADDAFEDVSGFVVEVYVAASEEERAMLDRARRERLGPQEVWVLDPTDWAALKLREAVRVPVEADRHLADVRAVARLQAFDRLRLQALASRWGTEAMLRRLDGP